MKAIENSPDVILVTRYFVWNKITVDPDDNKFVDCAVASNADYLCTEDKHFKVLDKKDEWPVVNVISANEFFVMLSPDDYLRSVANNLV